MKSHLSQALGLAFIALAPVLPANSQGIAQETSEQTTDKSGRKLVNKIVATVNGDVITLNELMIKVAPEQAVLKARYPEGGAAYETQLAQIKSVYLNDLIDRTIIFTEFRDRVRAFPDQVIEDEVKRIVDTVYGGDEELFKDYLKATNLTRDQFKEQQRKEILVQHVRRQHYGEVATPKDAELREEYEKWAITNRDRSKDIGTYQRIYLAMNRGSGPDGQLELAKQLVLKLRAGADFTELAKTHSNGSKADEGGLWKDIPSGDLNIEFRHFIFETKGNEVMGPLKLDPYGFSVIQVLKRDLGDAKPFEEVREEMIRRVVSRKKSLNYEKWMKKMRYRAIIKKMLKQPDANSRLRR